MKAARGSTRSPRTRRSTRSRRAGGACPRSRRSGTCRGSSRTPARREDWTAPAVSAAEHAALAGYVAAHESGDLAATLELITDDIRITMPPAPLLYEGREGVAELVARADGFGQWRLVPVRANRQPAAGCYVRRPGDSAFTAFKGDVLAVVDGRIAEITTFGVKHFPAFGLSQVQA